MIRSLVCLLALGFVAACSGGGGGGGGSSGGGGTGGGAGPVNNAPVANAGGDIAQSLSSSGIALNGTSSSDPDGDTLSYTWEITSQAGSGDGTLQNETSSTATFSASVPGDYTVRLTVRDPGGLSSTDSVTLSLANDAPVINLSAFDLDVLIGETQNYNAASSSDPNGHALTHSWELISFPSGSASVTQFSGAVIDTVYDISGDYVLEVTVSDGYTQSTQQLGPIHAANFVGSDFTKPITDADYNATTGYLVTVEGTTVTIIHDDGTENEVTIGGTGTLITINHQGTHAAVSYGANMALINLQTAQITGTYDFTENLSGLVLVGNSYAYGFPQTGGSNRIFAIDLNTSTTATPLSGVVRNGFVADLHPDNQRIYATDPSNISREITRISVSDDTITDTFNTSNRYGSIYSFCPNVWFSEDTLSMLDGCGAALDLDTVASDDLFFSHYVLGRPITVYSAAASSTTSNWYVIGDTPTVGPEVIRVFDLDTGTERQSLDFADINASTGYQLSGRYVFVNPNTGRLIIIAATGPNTTDAHMLLKTTLPAPANLNRPPVAAVQKYMTTRVNSVATLNAGSSSDPDGDQLTYNWQLVSEPSGSSLSLGDTTQSLLQFTPVAQGQYQFSVSVSDGLRTSTPETITVTAIAPGDDLVQQLSGQVVDFVYSDTANVGAYLIDGDDTVRLLDFANMQESIVPIAPFAFRLAFSADGTKLAISHTGQATLIDVASAQLTSEFDISIEWGDIALQNSGVAHIVQNFHLSNFLYSIDFNAGTFERSTNPLETVKMRLHPNENWLYGVSDFGTLVEMAKWDVTTLPTAVSYIKEIPDGVAQEEDLWFTEDGSHFLTGSGQLFTSTDTRATDIEDTDINLEGGVAGSWSSHSEEQGAWVVAEGNRAPQRILIFEDVGLTQTGEVVLQDINTSAGLLTSIAVQSHFNEAGTKVIGLTRAISDATVYAVQISDTP